MSPYFLSSDNLANVLTQIITTALLGFGMTYVIISGEIDLSIAPTLAMSSVIVATLLSKGYPMWYRVTFLFYVFRKQFIPLVDSCIMTVDNTTVEETECTISFLFSGSQIDKKRL